jgi:hypothetical protein
MKFARIDLSKTNYTRADKFRYLTVHDYAELNKIYIKYCRYKQFESVMPLFVDNSMEIIGYYDGDYDSSLIGFSLIRCWDRDNAECVQFSWDYAQPSYRLGIVSLENECAVYKARGFRYLYLGQDAEYKRQFDGYELLGPI